MWPYLFLARNSPRNVTCVWSVRILVTTFWDLFHFEFDVLICFRPSPQHQHRSRDTHLLIGPFRIVVLMSHPHGEYNRNSMLLQSDVLRQAMKTCPSWDFVHEDPLQCVKVLGWVVVQSWHFVADSMAEPPCAKALIAARPLTSLIRVAMH